MAYVPVPKDLNYVKTKVAFNLTKRQLICFSSGGAAGIPLFFWLRSFSGVNTAAMVMIIVMVPFFMFAMYEKNGQPLEKLLRNMIQVCFIRSKQRPYRTRNFYAAIQRQNQGIQEEKKVAQQKRAGEHLRASKRQSAAKHKSR